MSDRSPHQRRLGGAAFVAENQLMVVFWQGYGPIALFAGLLPVGAAFVLSYSLPPPPPVPLPIAAGLASFTSAAVCVIGSHWVRDKPGRHTLYFLPLSFWAVAYAVFGCYCLAVGLGLA